MYGDFTPKRRDYGDTWKWLGYLLFALILLAIMGFFLNWFSAPMQMFSPRNLQQLATEANTRWFALEAQKTVYGTAREQADGYEALYGEDTSKWPQGKRSEWQQAQRTATNAKAAYNNSCGQYNALWNNDWKSIPLNAQDLGNLPPRSCSLIE